MWLRRRNFCFIFTPFRVSRAVGSDSVTFSRPSGQSSKQTRTFTNYDSRTVFSRFLLKSKYDVIIVLLCLFDNNHVVSLLTKNVTDELWRSYSWLRTFTMNALGPLSPSVFCGKKIQSAALNHFVYVPMFWIFFPEIALGDGPKKWHIFLFNTAYFPS